MHKLSDEKLISLIIEGNKLAFHQLYNKYWEPLYLYTYKILNDKQLTEDTLHEVFTKIWYNRKQLNIKNAKSYLFKSVRNKSLTKIRDNKFTSFDEKTIATLPLTSACDENIIYHDLKATILKKTALLPPRCKDIFIMNKLEHYSVDEIAKHFNISKRTVENQISLAVKYLKRQLGSTVFSLLFLFW